MACAIASIHAARSLKRGGGPCECVHCQGECACDEAAGGYDDEQPLFDPEDVGR